MVPIMSTGKLCVFLGCLLLGVTSAAAACTVTAGPYSNILAVYRCPDCAYITKINIRGGCWIDGILNFVCSDSSIVSVNKGNVNGGGPQSLASAAGFTKGYVGTASDNGNFIAAAGMRLVIPSSQGEFSPRPLALAQGCRTYATDVWSTVATGSTGRIIGLQAEPTADGGSVARVGFLAGSTVLKTVSTTIPGGVSEFQVVRNNTLLMFSSNSPQLLASVVTNMVNCFFSSYSLQRARFNPNAPKVVSIFVDQNDNGVAGEANDFIGVGAAYLNSHPLDYGLIAHEGFHVVQSYSTPNAVDIGYWVEGLADYARYKYGCNNAAAGWVLTKAVPGDGKKLTNGYGDTAGFLVWAENRKNANIPTLLDATCRAGTYTPQFWTQLTGKTAEDLWIDYVNAPSF